jgi:mercuric ion transport protein
VRPSSLVRTGLIGAVITAVCCATPVLVLALGMAGLAGATVWLDPLLIATLVAFLFLAACGLYLQRRSRGAEACCAPPATAAPHPKDHAP